MAERPAEVELAIWFHDAVYDPRRSDDEEQSAGLACEVLRNQDAPSDMVSRIRNLILATRHDVPPADPDAALLVDIDLAILGASSDRFREYEEQIREEYSWVPADVFRIGRANILKRFLKRPTIYSTGAFKHRESQARSNLERSIRELGGQ